ncbi:beta-1,6-N-acetylglucosaminyltransferase [Spirosoma litoris]
MIRSLRLAYLVFVHKNPAQLGRLLDRLYTPGCTFYIHVDAKSNLTSFQTVSSQVPVESIIWLPTRTAITWGDFSLTAATLAGFDFILRQRNEPDFIITISGQDYPIVTNQVLQTWLADHIDQTILDYALVTEDSPHILERVEQYYFSIKPHRTIVYPYANPDNWKKNWFNKALKLSGQYPLPREFPMGHKLYFGTNWFQLKPAAARYVVEFAKSNPSYVNFSRTTMLPDEYFFQSILLNAPETIRNTIYNHRMTFMQWDRPPGSYVKPLSVSEIPSMLSSGKFFARKFDETYDAEVIDKIDQQLQLEATVVRSPNWGRR